jgi:drug efflux transport system permease protein
VLKRVLTVVYKELLAILRDKKGRTILIVPPLIQLMIFGVAATLDVKNATIGVLNRDSGEQAIELIQRFSGSPTFTSVIHLGAVEEIAPFIDNQKGIMVLSIDEQFSRRLDAGLPANVQLILDGRKSNSSQIVAGYAQTILDDFDRDFMATAGLPQRNSVLIPRNWYNPNLVYTWFMVPNLTGALLSVIALLVTSLSVAREREVGTFEQVLVSPLSVGEIMLGKTIPALILSLAEGSIIILAAVLVFRVPFEGSVLLLYTGMFIFVLSIIGVGLFISALSHTQQQAILGTFVFMAPAILLSGFATPIENMPEWLQVITYANPLRYYLVIVKGVMLKAMPAAIVWNNIWQMALIAACTLSGASWFFRRRLA